MGGSFFVIFGLARPGAARVQGTELKDFIFEQDIRKAAPNVIMMTCFLLFRSFVCHDSSSASAVGASSGSGQR